MKFIEEKYVKLNILEKQIYIKLIKDKFERLLASYLNLTRVSAPLLVTRESGLQDDLTGVERKVAFDLKKDGKEVEIVQSLAKWKRMALKKYDFKTHQGLYTDMQAIRRDDNIDETHSIYVDQWDWEKIILRKDRTISFLQTTVRKIVRAIADTNTFLAQKGFFGVTIRPNVHFISSQELLDLYPDKTDKEREYLITKEYKTVFIMQIGDTLSNGKPHDLRAPDYDDWSLNGDLFFYHEVLDMALEISSMGIRVDKESLISQIEKSKKHDRLEYAYHKSILADELPLTIGGGIGQSRLCMYILKKGHIGEVQSSIWDDKNIAFCEENGLTLL